MNPKREYLITCGAPNEYPKVISQAPGSELRETLEGIAKQMSKNGEDVTQLRVWVLTEIKVVTKAFAIEWPRPRSDEKG